MRSSWQPGTIDGIGRERGIPSESPSWIIRSNLPASRRASRDMGGDLMPSSIRNRGLLSGPVLAFRVYAQTYYRSSKVPQSSITSTCQSSSATVAPRPRMLTMATKWSLFPRRTTVPTSPARGPLAIRTRPPTGAVGSGSMARPEREHLVDLAEVPGQGDLVGDFEDVHQPVALSGLRAGSTRPPGGRGNSRRGGGSSGSSGRRVSDPPGRPGGGRTKPSWRGGRGRSPSPGGAWCAGSTSDGRGRAASLPPPRGRRETCRARRAKSA